MLPAVYIFVFFFYMNKYIYKLMQTHLCIQIHQNAGIEVFEDLICLYVSMGKLNISAWPCVCFTKIQFNICLTLLKMSSCQENIYLTICQKCVEWIWAPGSVTSCARPWISVLCVCGALWPFHHTVHRSMWCIARSAFIGVFSHIYIPANAFWRTLSPFLLFLDSSLVTIWMR